jgi:hypothetical protein
VFDHFGELGEGDPQGFGAGACHGEDGDEGEAKGLDL